MEEPPPGLAVVVLKVAVGDGVAAGDRADDDCKPGSEICDLHWRLVAFLTHTG